MVKINPWLKRQWFSLTCLLMIAVILGGAGIQIENKPVAQQSPGMVMLGIGEKVITIGSSASAAGAVDYTYGAANANVQFLAALNALPATGGRLVVVSAGTISFAAGVTRAIDNVTIECTGAGSYFTRDAINPIFTAGGNNWVFSNMRTDAGGIDMAATTGWVWNNVTVNATKYALRTPGVATLGGLTATSNLDIGSFDLRAQTFTSDVATGTAPFAISSTTVNTNLNADLVDGKHAANFLLLAGGDITGPIGISTAANAQYRVWLDHVFTITDNNDYDGIIGQVRGKKTTSAFTHDLSGVFGAATLSAGNTQNWTGAAADAAGVSLKGVWGRVSDENGSTATITKAAAFYSDFCFIGTEATWTNVYNAYFTNQPIAGAGHIDNAFGLYIEPITAGTISNYGVYSAGGFNVFVGDTAIGTATPSAFTALGVQQTFTDTTNTERIGGQFVSLTDKTTAAFTNDAIGVLAQSSLGAANNQAWSNALGQVGVYSYLSSAGGTGTVTGAANYIADASLSNATWTNRYGLYVKNATVGSTLTNQYGVYIEPITSGGTLNYSIYSGGGLNYFAGNVGVGTTPSASYAVNAVGAWTLGDNNERGSGIFGATASKTSANYTNRLFGVIGQATLGATNNQNWTNADALVGVWSYTSGAGGSGTVTGMTNYLATPTMQGFNVTNGYGLHIADTTGSGTLANQWGVYVEDLTKGTTIKRGFEWVNHLQYNSSGAFQFQEATTISTNNNQVLTLHGGTGGLQLGNASTNKIGFFGAAAVVQQAKAAHNNWAALSDVVSALVNLGLLDSN